MARRSKSVAAHSAVVCLLVGCLAEAGESYDDVAGTYVRVIDHVGAAHSARYGAIDNDCAHEVAHVGSFSARGVDADAHAAQFFEQFVGAVDDCGDYFPWNQHFVAPDGRGNKDAVGGADAEKVVEVHDERILRNAFPNGEVARLAPVGISQRRLRACSVGVHDVAVFWVAAEDVGNDLAECPREKAFVDITYRGVNVLFCCAHAACHVSFVLFHAFRIRSLA